MSQLFPAPREKNKQFTFVANQSLLDEIDRRSAAKSISKSSYIRLALQEYFRKEDKEN